MNIQEAKTLSSHYEQDAGAAYSAWQLGTARRTARIVARYFRPYLKDGQSVLDFGCGGGGVVSELPSSSKYGVEPNPASRQVALSRGITCEDDLSKLAETSVDVVISNHALEHCLYPLRELKEIGRVLRKSGTFVLVVPCEDWRAQPRDNPKDHNHHLYTWTPLTIANLIREAGFEVRSVQLKRTAWPPGVQYLTWLPAAVFNFICAIWSRITHVQEILLVARRPAN